MNQSGGSSEDPLSWISRVVNKLRSLWLASTYPFASVGKRLSVHYSCELSRSIANFIKIGDSVTIGRDAWLNIPDTSASEEPKLVLEDGCVIGRRCVLSAQNQIYIGRDVVFGPQVLVMDHNHEFEDVNVAIALQGTTDGGKIRIEQGCWIGFGAAIVSGKGELIIGKNSVVGANSVVTRSVPPHSIVTGNPARIVKQFDPAKGKWGLGITTLSNQKKSD
jgi:abequosyltransferase